MYYLRKFIPRVDKQFSFERVTAEYVNKLLIDLPSDKATGLDQIPVKLLKICGPVISNSFAHIFNKSLESGRFPSEMKHARVVSIFKKGNREDPGNYRPISILPVASKLLERIVHTQVTKFLTTNNLITDAQSGFRKNNSCETSLLRLTENILNKLNDGKVVGLVALDLKKSI